MGMPRRETEWTAEMALALPAKVTTFTPLKFEPVIATVAPATPLADCATHFFRRHCRAPQTGDESVWRGRVRKFQ